MGLLSIFAKLDLQKKKNAKQFEKSVPIIFLKLDEVFTFWFSGKFSSNWVSLSISCHAKKKGLKRQKNKTWILNMWMIWIEKKKMRKLFFFNSNFYCSLLASVTSCSEFHEYLKVSLSKKKRSSSFTENCLNCIT